jgi:UDP-glucose 4-epimerase
MKKVLIFGVTGNCGKALANRFKNQNWEIYGVGRSKLSSEYNYINYIQGDITDKELYTKLPVDIELVVNMAGVQPSILHTSEKTDMTKTFNDYVNINILGVFNILEYVRLNNIPNYIYTTSHRDLETHWGYNNILKNNMELGINYNGDHTMYAITKTSAKMIGDYYGTIFNTRVFNLRLPMIFLVPDEPYYLKNGKPSIMPFLKIIKDASEGKDLEIWGDPSLPRDYVHIDNLLNLIELCYKSRLQGGTFNVGTGEGVTTEQFVRSIGEIFGEKHKGKIKYHYKKENLTYKCAVYDVQEQIELLGYKPVLHEEMLQKLKNKIEEGKCFDKWGW